MKISPVAYHVVPLILCVWLAGCATAPTSTTQPEAAPTTAAAQPVAPPTTTETTLPMVPIAEVKAPAVGEISVTTEVTAPVPISPEASALVNRLVEARDADTLPHELSDATGFPAAMASLKPGMNAPKVDASGINANQPPPKGLTGDGTSTELIERDWTGLVLVPVNTALSKAYVSDVRLLKVEAHPLNDGRLRVWTRVRNIGRKNLPAEVACAFRLGGETTPPSPLFYRLQVPAGTYRDVFFVSPDGELATYTVLVRAEGMAR